MQYKVKAIIVLLFLAVMSQSAINKYWHVKSDGTGNSTQGTTWALAIDADTLEYVLENNVTAGDVFFIKEGTYTMSNAVDFSARDGTATEPIMFIGVVTATTHEGADVVYSDWASDTHRPLIDKSTTNGWTSSDYCKYFNLQFQGGASTMVAGQVVNHFYNCKFYNNSTTAGRVAIVGGNYSTVVDCEIYSDSGNGLTGSYIRVFGSYFHDMIQAANGKGIVFAGGYITVSGCKFYNCRQAINSTADHYCNIVNNSFYKCGDAINATTDYSWLVMNNIVDSSTVSGFTWSTQTDENMFLGNHGDDTRCTDMWNGVEVSTCHKDVLVTTGDPKFANPPDSLQLDADSPCLNTGIGAR